MRPPRIPILLGLGLAACGGPEMPTASEPAAGPAQGKRGLNP